MFLASYIVETLLYVLRGNGYGAGLYCTGYVGSALCIPVRIVKDRTRFFVEEN